ncbi:hypothetical protein CHUAL_006285 [Chamberlinius hualienensis]
MGPISPSQLGITLVHEHLSMSSDHLFYKFTGPNAPSAAASLVTMENRPWIIENFFHHRNNLILNNKDSESAILYDVNQFKSYGGGAIVDCSFLGLQRNYPFLKVLATMTGVRIIAGGGRFCFGRSQPALLANYSVEQMANTIRRQLIGSIVMKGPTSYEESLSLAADCPKSFLALDSFGHEFSVPGLPPAPQDGQRVKLLLELIEDGHEKSNYVESRHICQILGPIGPSQLGVTLAHEHLSMSVDHLFYKPAGPHSLYAPDSPVTVENRQWIIQNFFHHRNNLILNDDDSELAILYDVNLFKSAGGKSIVDCTSIGLHRNHQFLKTVAKKTGVHIIAGAGFYVSRSQSAYLNNESVENLANNIRCQLYGSLDDDHGIRCGVIGEVGVSRDILPFEKNSIAASAALNIEKGCPVIMSPPYTLDGILESIRIFEESGGDANKLAIANLDWVSNAQPTLQLADINKKVFLSLDTFGHEWPIPGWLNVRLDHERIELLCQLIKNGHENRILLSHDINAKIGLTYYGGHGYTRLNNLGSTTMRDYGIGDDLMRKCFIENPRNWLEH